MLQKLVQRSSRLALFQSKRCFGAFVNHRDTADNIEETPFEFTEESYKQVYEKMSHYPDNYKHSAVIPVLFIA